jgi:hypothetical protein
LIKIIGWKAWYEDAEFSSDDTEWGQLPDDGIVIVYHFKSDGRRLELAGDDSYFFAPTKSGDVWGSNRETEKQVQERYPGAIVKRGKWVPLEVFHKIQARAAADSWRP